jgi:hypothetical protein
MLAFLPLLAVLLSTKGEETSKANKQEIEAKSNASPFDPSCVARQTSKR